MIQKWFIPESDEVKSLSEGKTSVGSTPSSLLQTSELSTANCFAHGGSPELHLVEADSDLLVDKAWAPHMQSFITIESVFL